MCFKLFDYERHKIKRHVTDWEKRVYNLCNGQRSVIFYLLEYLQIVNRNNSIKIWAKDTELCLVYLLQRLHFSVCLVFIRCEWPSVFQKELHVTPFGGAPSGLDVLNSQRYHGVEINIVVWRNAFSVFLCCYILCPFLISWMNYIIDFSQFSFLRIWEGIVFTAKPNFFVLVLTEWFWLLYVCT